MSADTDSDAGDGLFPGTDRFENSEWVEQAHEDLRQQRLAGARDRLEQVDTQAWLEGRLEENTRTAELWDREFEFIPVGTKKTADVLEAAGGGGLDLAEMPTLLRDIVDVLGEHCTDPAMDAELWGKVPPDLVEGVFEEIAGGDRDLSAEELERLQGFRDQ